MVHCRLAPDDGGRALAIAQWMLDRTLCDTLVLSAAPVVSSESLRQLRSLLAQSALSTEAVMVQALLHDSTSGGITDAALTPSPPCPATRSVPALLREPDWAKLPNHTQANLRQLLAQLLYEHACRKRNPLSSKESSHE